MKTSRNNAKIFSAIVLVFLMASVILMTTMPVHAAEVQVNGALPSGVTPAATYNSIAHLSFRPNPVGLGQPILINVWLNPPTSASRKFVQAFVVTVTKPDGTKEETMLDTYLGDGTAWMETTADQVGTWTIKFDFLGTYYNGTTNQTTQSLYCTPASDGPYNLTVQQEQVASWPPSPLPTDYWTWPVQPHNRDWWPILGNYPSTGVLGGGPNWPADTNPTWNSRYGFIPYVQGPNTAHIVWRRQFSIGGLIGGDMGQTSSWSGPTLIYGQPSIIFRGRCYGTTVKPMLTLVNGTYRTLSTTVWQCYDLRTGQVYWEQTDFTAPTFIINDPGTPEVVGAEPYTAISYLGYIGNSRLIKYDPFTGAVVMNVSIPVSTGTFYADPYVLSVQDLGAAAGADRYRLINWTVSGTSTNFTSRIQSNITFALSSLPTTTDFNAGIAVSTSSTTLRAASIITGNQLWNVSTNMPAGISTEGTPAQADHGKVAVRFEDGHWHCWDIYTGTKLWVSELSSWPWGTFGTYGSNSYGGMIFSMQFDCLCTINWTNGKIVWKYVYETPFPYDSPFTGANGETVFAWHANGMAADGKFYVFNSEHSPDQPIKRGWNFHCINITTGKGIWNITAGQTGVGDGSRVFQGAIADGYVAISNAYDGYMYVFGKGKSATTVTAPDTAIAKGTTVLIKGTVMDVSPGDQGSFTNPTARLDSPTMLGTVPCVSAESMKTQMEYLYMQLPIDGLLHDVKMTGVPVKLTAIGSDNTVVNIGTTTTNPYQGTFNLAWTPPDEGTYQIIASFAGDDSYGSSSGATAVAVGPAPQTQGTPEIPLPTDITPLYYGIAAAAIAIILAVAIVGMLMLRKRP